MASRMQVALVFAFFAVAGVSAQGEDCSAAYGILAPCYGYVTGPEATVPQACCSGVSQLNSQLPTCLCSAISQLQGSAGVNVTKALALPNDCNVPVDRSQCPAFTLPPPGAATPPPGAATPPSPPMMSPPMASPPMMSPPSGGASPPMMMSPPLASPPSGGAAPPMIMSPPMMSPPSGGASPPMMMSPPMASPPSDGASPPMMISPPMMSPPEGSMAPSPMMSTPPTDSMTPAGGVVPGVPGVTDGPAVAPTAVESAASTVSASLSVFAAAAFTLMRLL